MGRCCHSIPRDHALHVREAMVFRVQAHEEAQQSREGKPRADSGANGQPKALLERRRETVESRM